MHTQDLRRTVRNRLVHSPEGFALLRRLRPSDCYLDRSTQLVVEGFPRSGNSFAEAAFLYANGGDRFRMAHHAHAAGQVLLALRREMPVLVLFRHPLDAVASFLDLAGGRLSAGTLLREYVQFHRPLLHQHSRIVFVSFEMLTTDFPKVVDRLNAGFGTGFRSFEHTPENIRAVYDLIERISHSRISRGTAYAAASEAGHRESRKRRLSGIRRSLAGSRQLAVPVREAEAVHDLLLQLEENR